MTVELYLLISAVLLLIANGVITIMTHKSYEKDLDELDHRINSEFENIYANLHDTALEVDRLKSNSIHKRKPGRPRKDQK